MAHDWVLIHKISAFLSSTIGRDKTCRLLQYIAMTIKVLQKNKSRKGIKSCDAEAKMETLANTMSTTRKVLRIGKPIGNCMQVIIVIRKLQEQSFRKPQESKKLLVFKGMKELLLILYYLSDHIVWLSRIGVINKQYLKKKMEQGGYTCWLLALFATIFYELELLNKIQSTLKDQKDEQIIKKINLEKKACFIELSRVILDIPVSAWYIQNQLVPEGLVAFLGLASSFIGCYQHWIK